MARRPKHRRKIVRSLEGPKWRTQHLKDQGGRCYYCGKEMAPQTKKRGRHLDSVNLDHLTPLVRGGEDSFENTVAACRSCNLDKREMTEEEYFYLIVRRELFWFDEFDGEDWNRSIDRMKKNGR